MRLALARRLARDTCVVVLIAGLLVVAIEVTVRAFWPQQQETTYVDGRSIGVPHDQLGDRLRPNAQARVVGPEFTAEYVIDSQGMRDSTERAPPKPDG